MPPEKILAILRGRAPRWATEGKNIRRLESFGIPPEDVKPLVTAFLAGLESGDAFQISSFTPPQLTRISSELSSPGSVNPSDAPREPVDRVLTRLLYAYTTSNPSLVPSVPHSTLSAMSHLLKSSDQSNPAEWFPQARRRPRTIIMHVGPTNSGKTHTALRALAASRVGCYCGPLRLLAHEIWERLNKGQIVPLGVEEPPIRVEPDEDSNFDVAVDEKKDPVPAVTKSGNLEFSRACNLLTGEEQRIVEEGAGLISCTVEMVPMATSFDVAVIDEIQMISDSQRGGAWTNAFLGLDAKELHLCGEETAIPVIEALTRHTGDKLVINRYQRLTPLRVAETSLGGNLGRVQKGDCVVSFSRSGIFGLKKRVEEETGLRCAVAYGRLPPEIRTEQAALFNKQGSGYDVLIGSDAIGMGLNLKIKRIIFDAVSKWDGTKDRFLTVSQIKQIAGRAGRYGLHDASSVGIATTRHPEDLSYLSHALEQPPSPLSAARLAICQSDLLCSILSALPPNSSLATVFEARRYLSVIPAPFQLEDEPQLARIITFLDREARGLTLSEMVVFMMSPVTWRDERAMECVARLMHMYRNSRSVSLKTLISDTEMFDVLIDTVGRMEGNKSVVNAAETLSVLESLHKVVVHYLWYTYRAPVSFPDQDEGFVLKERVEKVMEWCLKARFLKDGKSKAKGKAKVGDLETSPTQDSPSIDEEGGFGIKRSRGAIRGSRLSA
ncbi:hypothetical protein JAAARDRAFT_126493 [Jaapia argillacea MUCL 33604]|uniref:RNA helicase n=1 Tax=Jaapia argillacea MUCL 33604 TaxID=933084 RepID=A0A067PYA7_9AGAM|nr:hypothetical protein JAAARDRAFT_126493 [Jaapia argillacea MUCL 33604]